MSPHNWAGVRRLLVVRLDSMGDVLMTSPALRALREMPSVEHLTLLTSPAGAEIASLIPEVDEVLPYEAPWMKHTPQRDSSEHDWLLIEGLKRRRFDAAVIFTVFSQNPLPAALTCYMADIPLRLAHCRENPYQLLTDRIVEREPECGIRHEVVRQCELVQTIGASIEDQRLSLRVPASARVSVASRLGQLLPNPRPDHWIVVHPGATAASRRYPIESFAKAASLLATAGFRMIVTGSSSERSLTEPICEAAGAKAVSVAGELDLAETAALIEQAPLLLTNNTGPAHIAAAVGTPVVDLYALTNPQHTPWLVPQRLLFHDVPCKYCFKSVCPEEHHHCLRLVSPESVVRAVLELFDETSDLRFERNVAASDSKPLPKNTKAGTGVDSLLCLPVRN